MNLIMLAHVTLYDRRGARNWPEIMILYLYNIILAPCLSQQLTAFSHWCTPARVLS